MYFWNYKMLAEALRNNSLSQSSYHFYIAIFFVLAVLYFLPDFLAGGDLLSFLINAIVPAIWIGSAYFVNNRGDSKDFVRRFISLCVPIVLRSVAYALLVGFLFTVVIVGATFVDAAGYAQVGFLDSIESKGIVTIIIAAIMVWFLFIYPIMTFIKAFRIASGQRV